MAKILIVEDEALIGEEIKICIRNMGHTPIGPVLKAEKVMAEIERVAPDLILLDINLNGRLSGIEIARDINKRGQVPFLFLTAHADQDTLDRVKTTMPYGYIVKPFSEKELKANVDLALYAFAKKNHISEIDKMTIEQRFNIRLTDREFGILKSLIQGRSYKETAQGQYISVNTVKTYQKKLYQLFNVGTKVGLIKKIKKRVSGGVEHPKPVLSF